MKRPKILLVEDDEVLASSLKKFLTLNGFEVDTVPSYAQAADKTFENKYSLYIFDINLKDGSGIDLLEDLRFSEDNTPTIFITALQDINYMIKGFNAGAQDYIKKPFDPEELLVRIKARLSQKSSNEYQTEKLQYKDITIEGNNALKDGKNLELGEVQLNLLKTLIKNQGKIVPKENLLDLLHNPSDTALRVNLSKLKRKTGLPIKAVKGIGYILE